MKLVHKNNISIFNEILISFLINYKKILEWDYKKIIKIETENWLRSIECLKEGVSVAKRVDGYNEMIFKLAQEGKSF